MTRRVSQRTVFIALGALALGCGTSADADPGGELPLSDGGAATTRTTSDAAGDPTNVQSSHEPAIPPPIDTAEATDSDDGSGSAGPSDGAVPPHMNGTAGAPNATDEAEQGSPTADDTAAPGDPNNASDPGNGDASAPRPANDEDAGAAIGNCTRGDIDIRTTTVSGTIRVNGAELQDEARGIGTFSLIDANGYNADLARLPSTSYSAEVIPGSYDLFFFAESGSDIPARTTLHSGVEVGSEPLVLDLDLRSTEVSTTVTLNGAELPEALTSVNGYLELRKGKRDRGQLRDVSGGVRTTRVAPGTYDLYYSVYSRNAAELPTNTSAKLQSGIVIGDSAVSLEFDVPLTPVSVDVTINGTPLQTTPDSSVLSLENAAGDKAELTVTSSAGASSGPLIPGTYDLYYNHYPDGSDAPRHKHKKLQSGIVIGREPFALDVDVPATLVSGALTVNGTTVSELAGEGALVLQDSSGDAIDLLPDADGLFAVRVIPGTYDLVYGVMRVGGGDDAPVNINTILQHGLVVSGAELELDIDIPATSVTTAVAVNGEPFGGSGDEDGEGWVNLETGEGEFVVLAGLHASPFTVRVIPGTYDLYYGTGFEAGAVPLGRRALLQKGIVVGDAALELDVDVPATVVSGTVTINGAALTELPAGSRGAIELSDPKGGSDVLAPLLTGSEATENMLTGNFSLLVVPGSYHLVFSKYGGTTGFPVNSRATVGCFVAE